MFTQFSSNCKLIDRGRQDNRCRRYSKTYRLTEAGTLRLSDWLSVLPDGGQREQPADQRGHKQPPQKDGVRLCTGLKKRSSEDSKINANERQLQKDV